MKQKHKATYLQFVAPYYSVKELKELNFNCSARSHETAKSWYELNEKICEYQPIIGGTKYNDDIINKIRDFLYANSRPSSYRVSKKAGGISCRHLNDNIAQLHHLYISENSDWKCSEKYFRQKIHDFNIFIKPQRDSDLCGYCNDYRIGRLLLSKYNGFFAFAIHLTSPLIINEVNRF